MSKEVLLIGIIETVIFALPFCKLWFSVGSWKKEVDLKIQQTQSEVNATNQSLAKLERLMTETCAQLAVISAKVSLIIDNKIKKD